MQENTNLYDLKAKFLAEWPLERLRNMQLEEYSNLDKNSFTYWIEAIVSGVGSIWGGSSYKFGIYRRRDTASNDATGGRMTDGIYGWYDKYGKTAEEAFARVRQILVEIAEAAAADRLEDIDGIDLGTAYKWKVAFLYGDFNVVNVFRQSSLAECAKKLGYQGTDMKMSALNRYVLVQRGERDYFEFGKELWKMYENRPSAENINNLAITELLNGRAAPLNQIFFGPPGTGKTYTTVSAAVSIVDPKGHAACGENREALRELYSKNLIRDWESTGGRIGFCTFHQAFGYEDFVEGIKPVEPKEEDTFLKYRIEDGIFKRMCRLAAENVLSKRAAREGKVVIPEKELAKAVFYKVSLGDANDPADQEIFDYCLENGVIALGYGDDVDFSGLDEGGVNQLYRSEFTDKYGAQALNYFKNYLQVGNYVLVSYGNQKVRAIGKVVGEYFVEAGAPIRYKQFRKVEWLPLKEMIPVSDIYEKNFSQQTIYKLNEDWVKRDYFAKGKKLPLQDQAPDPFVLVIDEINRGNVASIFGELITLIEEDKRTGNGEGLEVVLPYSKQRFSVPPNLYIIGTMNTADRSIEALDTALRRRFSFVEMAPQAELIREEGHSAESDGYVDGIDLVSLLNTINRRIEVLLDKDHRIGHAYFMQVSNRQELVQAFRNKVIPLLEEYFFGDFGKIGLVLGGSFVERMSVDSGLFADFAGYDAMVSEDLQSRPIYRIRSAAEWQFEQIYL